MKNIYNEILQLRFLKLGGVLKIDYENAPFYLNRSEQGYAVAIPYNEEKILNESFVSITLATNMLNIGNESFKVLYLHMGQTGDLEKFAYVATEFVNPANRASIINNPYQWVDSWMEMFGNAKKKYLVTDVVAELLSLKHMYNLNKSTQWAGPLDGTHDIVFNSGVVEVKSTTNKSNNYVEINSNFQLNPTINEKLFFVRLEAKPYQNSIDSLVKELVDMGYSKAILEECLTKMGYREGKRTRQQSYAVLEISSYEVNSDNFPIIKLEDLNALTKSKNIVSFKMRLDLTGVPKEKIV